MKFSVLTKGHWPSLVGAWLHFEISFMVWLLVGALGVSISEDFGLGPTQKGLLVAIPLLGGAFLRVLIGPMSDRYGAKQVGQGILVLEVAALLMGWLLGTNYAAMLGVGLILGFAGASFAIALPIASRAYPPEHQGLAMGIAAVGNSGVLLATLLAPRIAEMVGWRTTFGVMIIPVLITMVVFQRVIPQDAPPPSPGTETSFWKTLSKNFHQPFMYGLCFFYGVTFGGFVGFSSFLPILFHDQYGVDIIMAGTLTAACGLAGSFARPVGGHWADKIGGLTLLQGLFPLLLFLCVLQYGFLTHPWGLPLMVLIVFLLGFGNGVVFQITSLKFQGMMGMASGMIGAAGGVGGFLLPLGFGLLKDMTGSYASGFLMFAIFAGVGLIGTLQMERYACQSCESAGKEKPCR